MGDGGREFLDNSLTASNGTAEPETYTFHSLRGANAEVPTTCGWNGTATGNDYTLIFSTDPTLPPGTDAGTGSSSGSDAGSGSEAGSEKEAGSGSEAGPGSGGDSGSGSSSGGGMVAAWEAAAGRKRG